MTWGRIGLTGQHAQALIKTQQHKTQTPVPPWRNSTQKRHTNLQPGHSWAGAILYKPGGLVLDSFHVLSAAAASRAAGPCMRTCCWSRHWQLRSVINHAVNTQCCTLTYTHAHVVPTYRWAAQENRNANNGGTRVPLQAEKGRRRKNKSNQRGVSARSKQSNPRLRGWGNRISEGKTLPREGGEQTTMKQRPMFNSARGPCSFGFRCAVLTSLGLAPAVLERVCRGQKHEKHRLAAARSTLSQ